MGSRIIVREGIFIHRAPHFHCKFGIVVIAGTKQVLYSTPVTVTVGWAMDNHLIVVQGQISSDEAMKIAENVKYIQ